MKNTLFVSGVIVVAQLAGCATTQPKPIIKTKAVVISAEMKKGSAQIVETGATAGVVSATSTGGLFGSVVIGLLAGSMKRCVTTFKREDGVVGHFVSTTTGACPWGDGEALYIEYEGERIRVINPLPKGNKPSESMASPGAQSNNQARE